MLLHRFLTACILIPLVLFALFKAPASLLLLLAGVLLLGCGWEFLSLIPCKQGLLQFLFMFSLLVVLELTPFCFVFLWSVAICCWIYLAYAVLRFPKTQSEWGHSAMLTFFGLSTMPISITCMIFIYGLSEGREWLLYFLLIVWATDTGAYAAGKIFGTHRLIPQVSPGKTVEGLMGGVFLAAVIGTGAYFYFAPSNGLLFSLQWVATVITSMLGDLTISMFKRRVGCKDTGTLLPGHGGLLDRLDSLIAAAPFFYGIEMFHWA